MTEEQLRIARNTKAALDHAKGQFIALEKIINGGNYGIKISRQNVEEVTHIFADEISFLTDLLEYRRKEVKALEREFANL
jgi:ATP-dependent exoDNAse (exonuclease V) alpha subunit